MEAILDSSDLLNTPVSPLQLLAQEGCGALRIGHQTETPAKLESTEQASIRDLPGSINFLCTHLRQALVVKPSKRVTLATVDPS